MKLIAQKDIDRKKWDALVDKQPETLLYHQSIFLDELSENWCLLVNDNYRSGIPLPFVVRFGKKGLYTPNFMRAVDWVGEKPSDSALKDIEELILNTFDFGFLRFENRLFQAKENERVYQILESPYSLNDQAKRSIKKFEKSDFKLITPQLDQILKIVVDELKVKVKDLTAKDFVRFTNLLNGYPKESLWLIGVEQNNEIVGGMIFIYWQNTLHYVKGGCLENAKNSGAMYAMMLQAIAHAEEKQLVLDFGGSNVDGVRRFNLAFGAIDKTYTEWGFDRSPWWLKVVKQVKGVLKR